MIKKLNNLLIRGSLISPYDEERTGHLVEACRSYVGQEDFDEIYFSNLVAAYVEGKYDENFQGIVSDFIKENYDENSDMPSCVWQTLTFFALYLALNENDDLEKRAIYSCSLQNRLIECKGRWGTLRFQKELVDLYYYMDSYIKDKCDINDVDSADILKQLYSQSGFQSQTISAATALGLKSIGRNAWEYQMGAFLHSAKVKEEKDIYIRIVMILEYLFINKPWLYMPVNLNQLLANTFSCPTPTSQESSLRTILKSLMDRGIVLVEEVKSTGVNMNCVN